MCRCSCRVSMSRDLSPPGMPSQSAGQLDASVFCAESFALKCSSCHIRSLCSVPQVPSPAHVRANHVVLGASSRGLATGCHTGLRTSSGRVVLFAASPKAARASTVDGTYYYIRDTILRYTIHYNYYNTMHYTILYYTILYYTSCPHVPSSAQR